MTKWNFLSLSLFQYRIGEACLEEMHPGRRKVADDRRRRAESGGHRKTGKNRDRKYKRLGWKRRKNLRHRRERKRGRERVIKKRKTKNVEDGAATERNELRWAEKLSQRRMKGEEKTQKERKIFQRRKSSTEPQRQNLGEKKIQLPLCFSPCLLLPPTFPSLCISLCFPPPFLSPSDGWAHVRSTLSVGFANPTSFLPPSVLSSSFNPHHKLLSLSFDSFFSSSDVFCFHAKTSFKSSRDLFHKKTTLTVWKSLM